MSKACVPGGQVPLRTLVRAFDLRIFVGGEAPALWAPTYLAIVATVSA